MFKEVRKRILIPKKADATYYPILYTNCHYTSQFYY